MNHIILIGFMGSGKTSVGKKLADTLNLSFLDTDEQIEKTSGMKIADIFEKYGEVYFRELETETLKDVYKRQIEHGADKIRINPGNIGSKERLKAVVDAAKERNIPIRVGVNSGSLEKEIVERDHGVTAEGIVESALDKAHMIEEAGYDQIVISIKSSDVLMCAKAHELIAEQTTYPLHVGITEAGTLLSGNIKSAVGLGLILSKGIGDTIRVSLTGDPIEEIKSAKLILRTLGLRKGGIEVVSCPTCGRTQIDLIGLANRVENMVADIPLNLKAVSYTHLDVYKRQIL